MTLTPAYGRDYSSKAKAIADFNDEKDFIIADLMHAYSGKPCNRQQLIASDYPIMLRYKKLTQVCVISKPK